MLFFIFKSYDLIVFISGTMVIIFLMVSLKFKNLASILLFCLFCVIFLFILFFFRNPHRKIVLNDNIILSPCDGKVLKIINTDNNRTLIYIFLSIFDVHRFRIPVSGRITNITYKKGKFNMAFNKLSIDENESNEISIETKNGDLIKIKQIAGYIARRIFCDIKENDMAKQGDIYGLISFGSGCLIDMPSKYKVVICEKSRVKAGLTFIAEIEGK